MRRYILIVVAFLFGAPAQAQYLSADEILENIPGRWAPKLSADPTQEFDYACDAISVEIWIEYVDNIPEYRSQFVNSGADEPLMKSDIRTIKDNSGNDIPAILLKYEDEQRTTDAGDIVEWMLIMPSKDSFVWKRRDWPAGAYFTDQRIRCPETNNIG